MCAFAAVRKIGSLARSNIHQSIAAFRLCTHLHLLILGYLKFEEGLEVKGYLLSIS